MPLIRQVTASLVRRPVPFEQVDAEQVAHLRHSDASTPTPRRFSVCCASNAWQGRQGARWAPCDEIALSLQAYRLAFGLSPVPAPDNALSLHQSTSTALPSRLDFRPCLGANRDGHRPPSDALWRSLISCLPPDTLPAPSEDHPSSRAIYLSARGEDRRCTLAQVQALLRRVSRNYPPPPPDLS